MKVYSRERWDAAFRIVSLCPDAAGDLDICLSVLPGTVFRRAESNGYLVDVETEYQTGGLEKNLKMAAMHAGTENQYRNAVTSVANIVSRQVKILEQSMQDNSVSDSDVRISANLAKSLHLVDELRKNTEKAADDGKFENEDLLEIHGRIIEKIELAVERAKESELPEVTGSC